MKETVEIMVSGYDQVFLREAEACAERSREGVEKEDSFLEAGAAASAVAAACAAVESFVSERATVYSVRTPEGAAQKIPPELLKDLRSRPGGGSIPLWRKVHLLAKHFDPDQAGLCDHPSYEPFVALVRLRGVILHRSARYLTTAEWPHGIKRKDRALIPHRASPDLDWTSRVFTDRTAGWAVDTVKTLLGEAEKWVPRPKVGELLKVSEEVEDGIVFGDSWDAQVNPG